MKLEINAGARRVKLSPRDPDFFPDPYPAYREIARATNVFFWEDYGFWCFSGHAEVSALLRDKRFGRQVLHVTTREDLGWPARPDHLGPFDAIERHSLLELEPPEHTRLRGLINRAFVTRQVERLAPRIAALSHQLIDGFERQGGADLLAAFATPIPIAVIAQLIGAPGDMSERMLEWSHRMVAMYQFGVSREVEDKAAAASAEFVGFVRALIAERRSAPRDDLVSRLIEAETGGSKLTEAEMTTTIILLLNAGHEATVHGLGNAAKALLENGVAPIADDECVDELLRFDAPLHLFTRYALEELEISGVKLKVGDRIGLMLGAANRDPRAFTDPDRLNLYRVRNPHVSFGAGIHFCVAASYSNIGKSVTQMG